MEVVKCMAIYAIVFFFMDLANKHHGEAFMNFSSFAIRHLCKMWFFKIEVQKGSGFTVQHLEYAHARELSLKLRIKVMCLNCVVWFVSIQFLRMKFNYKTQVNIHGNIKERLCHWESKPNATKQYNGWRTKKTNNKTLKKKYLTMRIQCSNIARKDSLQLTFGILVDFIDFKNIQRVVKVCVWMSRVSYGQWKALRGLLMPLIELTRCNELSLDWCLTKFLCE